MDKSTTQDGMPQWRDTMISEEPVSEFT